jgi:hypothetical protein
MIKSIYFGTAVQIGFVALFDHLALEAKISNGNVRRCVRSIVASSERL